MPPKNNPLKIVPLKTKEVLYALHLLMLGTLASACHNSQIFFSTLPFSAAVGVTLTCKIVFAQGGYHLLICLRNVAFLLI
ncbi:hypothetical protein L596_028765 [Steinernema carpocapsae]|uniref:Uncharacterized protein n=1 Tax=Steinernema carpocapsae TaxID=34508 RepID=A0A4V5ZXZ4_STECR|nr:hypothetical protein L596_028765 [Steinernema carpocapsae]